jgi:uridine kinase
MSLFTERAIREVALTDAVNGIRIVGVDGPSGSGKSTFAKSLGAALGAPVIPVDDFVSWTDLTGWWPRFEAQVLAPLLAGEAAHYQRRDWENDEFGEALGEWETVPWQPIVIVEGLTCTRRASMGTVAYAIWVEAPDQERLRRGLARDGEDHRALWLTAMAEEKEFFTADGTRDRADFIVPGW